MKTLIIASSKNPESHSFKLCESVYKKLKAKEGTEVTLLNLQDKNLSLHYEETTDDMKEIEKLVEAADNFIFGMAVRNYCINDELKTVSESCFHRANASGKFFGTVCAAGGEKSYLVHQQLVQLMMNEFRMIPLPRIVYSVAPEIPEDRIELFVEEFHSIGKKLLS